MKNPFAVVVIALATALSGCASTQPQQSQSDEGQKNSTREVRDAARDASNTARDVRSTIYDLKSIFK